MSTRSATYEIGWTQPSRRTFAEIMAALTAVTAIMVLVIMLALSPAASTSTRSPARLGTIVGPQSADNCHPTLVVHPC